MTCMVLRCSLDATASQRLGPEGELDIPYVVAVCDAHAAALLRGDDWAQGPDGELLMEPDDLAGDHVWLMADWPKLSTGIATRYTSTPGHGIKLTLPVRRRGTTDIEYVEVLLDREYAEAVVHRLCAALGPASAGAE